MATTPTPPPATAAGSEPQQLKLKAKDWFSVEGIAYQPGDTLSLPASLALGIVGIGAADELPPESPV